MRSLGIDFHLYADDTQLYVTFKSNNPDDLIVAKSKIEECVRELDEWLTMNKLKLNSDKTEILVFSARHLPSPSLSYINVCDDVIGLSTKARNIGIIMDSNVTMESQVSTICKSGFYYLRKISKVRKYLILKSAEILVHALVTSRLDFGNALLHGLSILLHGLSISCANPESSECSSTNCHINEEKRSHNSSAIQSTLAADQEKDSI